jgi:hypothetical protein
MPCHGLSLMCIPGPENRASEIPSWGQKSAGKLLCMQKAHRVILEEEFVRLCEIFHNHHSLRTGQTAHGLCSRIWSGIDLSDGKVD